MNTLNNVRAQHADPRLAALLSPDRTYRAGRSWDSETPAARALHVRPARRSVALLRLQLLAEADH